ncbi:MAG TPA: tetratricopeptide repeat protein, partial [Chloroflexota bacterium]|nr:tetratricopeptide repeat protein [Chloroflexota bacterium]
AELAQPGPARAQATDEVLALRALFVQLYQEGRYPEAAAAAQRLLAVAEARFGPEHPQVAGALSYVATAYRVQGRYAEAEPHFKRALALFEKTLGPGDINVAVVLNELAQLYYVQGRLADAEPLFVRAIDIEEKLLGPDDPQIATLLNNLAALYRAQAKYALAEQLRKRTIAILEKSKGPDDPVVAVALDNLAVLYQSQERYAEAEPLTERALAILEKALGPDHPDVGISLNNLASIYLALRKYAKAEPLYRRSLAISEKRLGPTHLEVAKTLDNLAGLYRIQGRYEEAEPVYRRALAIFEATYGSDHPDVALFYNNLGGFYFDQGKWAASLEASRKATAVFIRRTQRGLDLVGQTSTGRGRRQAAEQSLSFVRLLKAAHRLSGAGGDARLSDEAFQAAQWAHASEAAASLAQMAIRSAAGDRELALLVRERQDLLIEWEKRNGLLVWARSQPPDRRDPRVDQRIQDHLAALNARLEEIDRKLKDAFPQYSSLVTTTSLDIAEVQAWLRPGEALVQFLDVPELMPFLDADLAKPDPEETFVWVVTRTEARWLRSSLGSQALRERVAALRCGLDHTLWQMSDSAGRCAAVLGVAPREERVDGHAVRALPFDPGRAHELYRALLGPAEDLIRGKHLLIVPSGPLTSLPFAVLAAEPAADGPPATLAGFRKIAWLGTRQPITVLPSVAALKSLRQFAKASRAGKPYLGIGNPLLDGQQSDPRWGDHYRRQAAAA